MNANRRKQISQAIEMTRKAWDILNDVTELLNEVRDDEEDAFDNMPESLQESERGEMMTEAIDNLDSALSLDYDDLLDELVEYLEEASA